MAKQCFFCLNPVDSAEHLWSEWILKEIKPTEPIRFAKGKHPPKWIDNPEVRITCVCHKCNNSWMSDIEIENKPHMLPMIRDHQTTLEPQQQKSLTRWAILKAIVLQGADRGRAPFYTDDERRDFKPPSSLIPAATHVWIGRYSEIGFHAGGTGILRPLENIPKAIHGLVTTIVVGHLAIQVLTLRVLPMFASSFMFANPLPAVEDNPGKWDLSLLGIWPVFGTLRWPPAVSFTSKGSDSIGKLVFRWKVGTDMG